jgi:hypothetical protein
MDHTLVFRRSLANRLIGATLVALPAALAAATGCGSGGVGGSGGSGGEDVQTRCFTWPEGAGGSLGAGGSGGTGGAGGGTDPVCPTQAEAKAHVGDGDCGGEVSVKSDGTYQDGKCCYEVSFTSCGIAGRPFLVEDHARTAAPRRDEGGHAWDVDGAALPEVASLSAVVRARLAEAWTRDGLLEHASVASFGRFTLELMAVGAPAELIEQGHRAALDEVRHARLCLGLAAAYAGEAIVPAPFPFGGRVEVSSDLAEIAARTAREGCIGETLAAVQAAEQLARATDPAVRAALAIIAED